MDRQVGARVVLLVLLQAVCCAHGIRLPPIQTQAQTVQAPDHKAPDLTKRPIICVLTQPGDLAGPGESYVSAGYIKWLEAAGARVAPVLYDMSDDKITELFNMCNGIVFPGGNQPLKTSTQWFKTAELLYGLAVKANKKGKVYPVIGMCLGLQLLATLVTRDEYALVPLDAHNHPTHVTWTPEASQSRLLSHVPAKALDDLQKLPIAMHNHYYGLVDESFEQYPELGHTYRVLSHTHDKQNKPYVSIIEAKDMPFAGLAFHPEKVPYEWTEELDIPHTQEALDASYFLASAFVSLARKNDHRGVTAEQEDDNLIYNWHPRFMGKRTGGHQEEELPFEQVYIFELGTQAAG